PFPPSQSHNSRATEKSKSKSPSRRDGIAAYGTARHGTGTTQSPRQHRSGRQIRKRRDFSLSPSLFRPRHGRARSRGVAKHARARDFLPSADLACLGREGVEEGVERAERAEMVCVCRCGFDREDGVRGYRSVVIRK
ncbi:hypothetical protein LTR28_010708, partial [Elasticomyces elasticus]